MRCDSAQRVLAAKEKETPDCEWEGSCDGPLVDDWVKRPFETYGDETLDEIDVAGNREVSCHHAASETLDATSA